MQLELVKVSHYDYAMIGQSFGLKLFRSTNLLVDLNGQNGPVAVRHQYPQPRRLNNLS